MATKWIKATKTFHLDDDCKAQQKKLAKEPFIKVCKKHFDQNAFKTNATGQDRLARSVYPTRLLPGTTYSRIGTQLFICK